ncbi:hypothetical protein F511_07464 [Dorcoceras hygrometricum]|uniref:RRM domain-containing protein n=1 Tax=Dorcoceras hygrometricum TaxID=472368 RepID=A0A2Z7C7S0_9LAMI|nr:hypothetical protein F511_07464 [Dorcoceras hygrometricum]
MTQLSETHHKLAIKGTEVFVGGLPRTISEDKIRQEFSVCGEIVEIRLIKDQKGNLKGFCFVRFSTKEAASRAVREKSGTSLDGKTIGVLPSVEHNALYFGNLNKDFFPSPAWSADEFEKLVLQVFPDVVSVDLPVVIDMQPGQKPRNRGFAFVRFSSHAAAARAQRVASQPDFRLGNLHPAVQWAEEDPEIDPKELAKIKIAFIRNLPINADENFLKQTFEPFGKVEKVVVSKKSSIPVGFVHFTERSDLDRAVKEMNEKAIQGPGGGPILKLQVEVARPMVDKNKKRAREDAESSTVQGHSKFFKEEVAASSINPTSYVQNRELLSPDPYEDAVIALPFAVKERLLRILRLGLATRFDIDVKSLYGLKKLPESTAISILDQFMLTGPATQHKGAYLAMLISRYLVDIVGVSPSLASLPKVGATSEKELSLLSFSHRLSPPAVGSFPLHSTLARPDIYAPRYTSSLYDYPLPSRTTTGRLEEKSTDFFLPTGAVAGRLEEKGSDFPLPSQSFPSGSQGLLIPKKVTSEDRSHPHYEVPPSLSMIYGKVGSRIDERPPSSFQAAPSSSMAHVRHGLNFLSSDITASGDRQASRPRVRFDPFTGEPYKFDPFTGEPIVPGS